jgi:hypothetical protein
MIKWIVLGACLLGLGCQKTIHEARGNGAAKTQLLQVWNG